MRKEFGVAVLLSFGMLLASIWQLHVLGRHMPLSHSDLVPVWVGVRTTLASHDPYSVATTRAIQTVYYGRPLLASDGDVNQMGFAYPAYTAIVLAWLAPLNWPQVQWFTLALLIATTAVSVLAWTEVIGVRMTRGRTAVCVLAAMASWPIIWALRLQQVSLLVAGFAALGCFLLKRDKNAVAGGVLALTTIKPQLVVPLLAWLALWAVIERRWRFITALATSIAALSAAAEWLIPGWLSHWRKASIDLLSYTHQRPALQATFGTVIGGVLMLTMAVLTAIALWRLRKSSVDSPGFGAAISLALGATVALIPTDVPMLYNQVFLVPGCLILIHGAAAVRTGLAHRLALSLLAWGFLSVPLAAIGECIWHSSAWQAMPFWNPLLPVAVTGALALSAMQIS
jgi:hypothetical protein